MIKYPKTVFSFHHKKNDSIHTYDKNMIVYCFIENLSNKCNFSFL